MNMKWFSQFDEYTSKIGSHLSPFNFSDIILQGYFAEKNCKAAPFLSIPIPITLAITILKRSRQIEIKHYLIYIITKINITYIIIIITIIITIIISRQTVNQMK